MTQKLKTWPVRLNVIPAGPDRVANREIGSPRPVPSRIEGLDAGLIAHVEKASLSS